MIDWVPPRSIGDMIVSFKGLGKSIRGKQEPHTSFAGELLRKKNWTS